MVQPANNLPNFRELSEKAEKIYNSLEKEFVKDNAGKYIAIELNAEEKFVGDTRDEAVTLAKIKYPTKLIFVRRIGPIESISRHVMCSARA